MAEGLTDRVWTGRMLFVALALCIVFVALLPLNTLPRTWAAPDLLLLVTLVWAIRRPDHVPVLLVGGIFLLTDLLFDRPPGLWTALVVILTEALRARAPRLRTQPFFVEWVTVGLGIIAITLGARAALSVALVQQAPVALSLIQLLVSLAIYPVVAGAVFLLFGIGRPAPGEVDASGRPL